MTLSVSHEDRGDEAINPVQQLMAEPNRWSVRAHALKGTG